MDTEYVGFDPELDDDGVYWDATLEEDSEREYMVAFAYFEGKDSAFLQQYINEWENVQRKLMDDSHTEYIRAAKDILAEREADKP